MGLKAFFILYVTSVYSFPLESGVGPHRTQANRPHRSCWCLDGNVWRWLIANILEPCIKVLYMMPSEANKLIACTKSLSLRGPQR